MEDIGQEINQCKARGDVNPQSDEGNFALKKIRLGNRDRTSRYGFLNGDINSQVFTLNA